MLHEFWQNFTHNLFKPLLLFFYLGFLIPILKVRFEFPYVIYQGLTTYLLVAIGWHGGEELAHIKPSNIGSIAGFMVVGFVLNFVIGTIAYFLLNHMTTMRRVDRATVAGYYGSDSAGTFATCVGVLTSLGMAFNAYMPVMLAIMEVPGCLVALYLVGRLRRKGMDAAGVMPDEPGYSPPAKAGIGAATAARPAGGRVDARHERGVEQQLEFSLEKVTIPNGSPSIAQQPQVARSRVFSAVNSWGRFSSTLGLHSLSAGFLSGSSVHCRARRSFTTTTRFSCRPSRVCSACSYSRWACRPPAS